MQVISIINLDSFVSIQFSLLIKKQILSSIEFAVNTKQMKNNIDNPI